MPFMKGMEKCLVSFMRSPYATAQPGLSVKKIVELPFPLPPKSEQVRIASKVKELMKQVEALSGLEITS